MLINDITTGQSLYANCTSHDVKMLGILRHLVTKRQNNVNINDPNFNAENLIFIEECIPSENIFQTHAVSYIAGAIVVI